MKIPRFLGLLLLLILLGSSTIRAEPPLPTPEVPPFSPDDYPFDLTEVISQSAALAPAPIRSRIEIAITGAYESDPAVALCASDQYLVVYILSGGVYGQRLTSAGSLLGDPFVIYNGTYYATEPDVACEWSHNRFVVVWAVDYNNQGTDYDVYGQGVYGGHQSSGSQLHGSMHAVAQGTVVERDPAIACNSNDYTCLVVFEGNATGNGDIYGQRISVDSAGINQDGDPFNVSNFAAAEINADISWGGLHDSYMVVWQYLHNAPSTHYRIVYATIHDTEQGPTDADEIRKGGTWLLPPDQLVRNQQTPAVAYNREQGEYLVVFSYEYSASDHDLYARRYRGTDDLPVSIWFSLVNTAYDEFSPAVAFSGGPESFIGGMGANQYLVTYLADEGTNGYALYGVGVKGNASGVDQFSDRREIARIPQIFMWHLGNPDVTGSINNGHYLTVWDYYQHGIAPDYDVFGQMVVPYMACLPYVLR